MSKKYSLQLPITKGYQQGYFALSKTINQSVKSKLINLCLTKPNERLYDMQNFGLGIQSLLFQQINTDLETKLIQQIANKIKIYIPQIKNVIIQKRTQNSNIDENKIILFIKYKLQGQQQDSVSLTIMK